MPISLMFVSVVLLNVAFLAASVAADDAYTCSKATGDQAIAACSREIASGKRTGHDLAIIFYSRGFEYHKKRDYDRAEADFDAAIRLDPMNVSAYVGRGLAYFRMRDYDRAIADFDAAMRLGPKNALAFLNRGNAYEARGDHDRAIADFDEAMRLDPKNAGFVATGFFDRGVAYFNKCDYERSIADYEEAIRLYPKFAPALENLEKARAALAEARETRCARHR